MSPHAAWPSEALQAIDLLCGWGGGWMPMEFERDGRCARFWHRAGSGVLPGLVRRSDELRSDEIRIGLPRRSRHVLDCHDATVLWCRVEGRDQLKRARAFRPLPTLVLQEGASTRRLLVWSLTERLDYDTVQDFNRRIAYRLHAPQKWACIEALWLPAPGTFLRVGRTRPVAVVCGRLTTASYTAMQVAGRLKSPPVFNWWEAKTA